MNTLLTLPILFPMLGAIACVLAWRAPMLQRGIAALSALGLLLSSIALMLEVDRQGVLAAQMGGWAAPYGITLVADRFAAIMVLLNGIVGAAIAVYAVAGVDERRERYGHHPLTLTLLAAVTGAFLTGDLFNLYVWFEVMLMASFVLLTLGGERQQLEGSIKYVALNLLSSALFLAAIGLVYGVAGSLNMADLHARLAAADQSNAPVTAIAMLFLVAFGIKAALFPFFFWLPASYHTPPPVISALFAGLLTKVGVYALIRVFALLFNHDLAFTHTIILWVAGFTMLTGVLGAAAQGEIRRILSFHIVSQIGYMIMGLALAGLAMSRANEGGPDAERWRAAAALAMAGAIFYILHHIIVKTNLFLVSGVVMRLRGTGELARVGGLYKEFPLLSALFLIPAMSLAGVPALSGFWAKLALVRAGIEAERYAIVAVSLVVSLLTLYSMTKIWGQAFWAPPPEGERSEEPTDARRGLWWMLAPIGAMALLTVLIGLGAGPVFDLSMRAAEQLLDPASYVEAVLGDAR